MFIWVQRNSIPDCASVLHELQKKTCIDYIAKWWQIKSFLVFMIFTPQCLVSRYNLAKLDPIKQLYGPHFGIRCIVWWRTQNILSGNKGQIDSESTFYWHHVPQEEIVQNIETRGRSKLRPRLHGFLHEFCYRLQYFLYESIETFAQFQHWNGFFEWLLRVALNQSCYTESR